MSERSLITATILFLVTLVIIFVVFLWLQFPPPKEVSTVNLALAKVKYLEQYVKVFQIVAVGVLAAIITAIIPRLIPEARDRFERYKESRSAYSKAKTAVLYLPDKVANADNTEALELVEKAHQKLHYAETFETVIIAKGYLNWFANPNLWILYNYWQIFAVAEVLRKSDWNTNADRDALRENLREIQKAVRDFFGGERGEKFAEQKWVIEKASSGMEEESRFKKEDEIKRLIDKKLKGLISKPSGTGRYT